MTGDPDPWDAARDAARDQVRSALARREAEVTCAHCGWTGTTAAARCPGCGRPWAARRRRGLSPRGRRRALATTILALAAGTVAAAIAVPRIDDSKRRTAAREQRERSARDAERRALLRREQRPRSATATPAPPGDLQARLATLATLEAAITRDARARVRTGSLEGPVRHTVCEQYPVNVNQPPPGRARAAGSQRRGSAAERVRRSPVREGRRAPRKGATNGP